jgi:hypothetical protein
MIGDLGKDRGNLPLQFQKRNEETQHDSGLQEHANRSRDRKDSKDVLQSAPLHIAQLHKVVPFTGGA